MSRWMAIERRRFPRLTCRASVQYRDLLQPRALQAADLSRDLSAGGLQFQTAQFFSRYRRLVIQVTLPGVPQPVRTIAQVMWTRKQPLGDLWDVGAHFVEITAQDRGLLADYVERGVHVPTPAPASRPSV